MKLFCSLSLFLLMFMSSKAQQGNLIPLTRGSEYTAQDANVLNNANGSPYFEEEFTPGILVDTETDSDPQKLYFRYNVVSDQIEIKVSPNQNERYILPKQERYKYRLKDYSYRIGNFKTSEGRTLSGYLIQYYKGNNVSFFCKPQPKIIPGREAKTSFETEQPAKLEIDPVYYLQMNNEPLVEVKLKKKDFKELANESPKMSKYSKDHKIKEIGDVVKMLVYFEAN